MILLKIWKRDQRKGSRIKKKYGKQVKQDGYHERYERKVQNRTEIKKKAVDGMDEATERT